MENKRKVDVSLVLPVMNERENIVEITEEVVDVIEKTGLSYEIFLINVPDRQNTFEVMGNIGKKFDHVYPIKMKFLHGGRFQKSYQYMLGFKLSNGDKVITMDSDYEDDPKYLPDFIAKLDEGNDLVVGSRQNRKHEGFYKFSSKIQNYITRLLTGVKVKDKNTGFKGYSRAAVDSLNLHGLNYRDIPVLLSENNMKITEIPIQGRSRLGGKGNFSFLNRLKGGTVDFLADVLMAKSAEKPFQFWGICAAAVGFLGIIALAISMLLTGASRTWSPIYWLMFSLFLGLTAIIFFAIGVVLEFIIHRSKFDPSDYYIMEDPKDISSERLSPRA